MNVDERAIKMADHGRFALKGHKNPEKHRFAPFTGQKGLPGQYMDESNKQGKDQTICILTRIMNKTVVFR
jgi:hypothetical protein